MRAKERLDLFYEKLNENNMRFLLAKIVAWIEMTLGASMSIIVYSNPTGIRIILFGLLWGFLAIKGRTMAYTSIRENNVQKNVWSAIKYTGIEKREWAKYLRNIVIPFELKSTVLVIFFTTMGILIGRAYDIPFGMRRAVLAYIESIAAIIMIPYLLYELDIKFVK